MNQVLARSFNERLIMSLLLQHESMTRMEIGQQSGLSAQTISVIVRALERDNLIIKGEAVRGRIGPPTTPIRLNPNGAFSIGLHIDHSDIEAVLINFIGDVLIGKTIDLPALDVASVQDGLDGIIKDLLDEVSSDQRSYLTGIGVTLPDRFGVDEEIGKAVLQHNFENNLSAQTGLEVYIQNDITAAASAEMLFGEAKSIGEMLYCHVSDGLKPRLVLGGRIYSGTAVCTPILDTDEWLRVRQQLRAGGGMQDGLVADWVARSSQKLSELVQDLSKFTTVPTMVFSSTATKDLMDVLEQKVAAEGVATTVIKASSLGPKALAIGAASLPIHSKLKFES